MGVVRKGCALGLCAGLVHRPCVQALCAGLFRRVGDARVDLVRVHCTSEHLSPYTSACADSNVSQGIQARKKSTENKGGCALCCARCAPGVVRVVRACGSLGGVFCGRACWAACGPPSALCSLTICKGTIHRTCVFPSFQFAS